MLCSQKPTIGLYYKAPESIYIMTGRVSQTVPSDFSSQTTSSFRTLRQTFCSNLSISPLLIPLHSPPVPSIQFHCPKLYKYDESTITKTITV